MSLLNISANSIKPLGNRVTLKILHSNKNQKFFVPAKEEETCIGEILNINDNTNDTNNDTNDNTSNKDLLHHSLNKGDKVLFNRSFATKLNTHDNEIFIVDIEKIIGKIT